MNDEILELPEVHCKGCDGRDRIIQSLAKELDRLEPSATSATAADGRERKAAAEAAS